jgi:hypothetical protein
LVNISFILSKNFITTKKAPLHFIEKVLFFNYNITIKIFIFLPKKSSNTKITPAGGFALGEHQETTKNRAKGRSASADTKQD